MASEWYYAQGGEKFGPVPDSEVRMLLASEKLSPNDLVWKEGMADWMPAGKIEGLIPKRSAAEPPPLPTYSHVPAPPNLKRIAAEFADGIRTLVHWAEASPELQATPAVESLRRKTEDLNRQIAEKYVHALRIS